MPVIEGTARLKTAVGEYDFAVDGGAVGTITLRSSPADSRGNLLPNNSVLTRGYIEVDTIPASGGAATIGVGSEAAGDLLAAAVITGAPWSTTGRKELGFSGAKTSAARSMSIAVAVAALTAGKFRVVVFYR
jgi:hypothetical protein